MNSYSILGLMSGTSLDGLDLACCRFWKQDSLWTFEIEATKTVPYSPAMKEILTSSIDLQVEDLLKLDIELGRFMGVESASFLKENELQLDAIASHGHTVHHRPDLGFTTQIGSGQELAISSGHKVICQFRSKDIALGGQGAPLVPIGDQMFFGKYDFCLNLGGISNVSFEKDGGRIAYDIGIANMLLNHLSKKQGKEFDEGGATARSGILNQDLLDQLNRLDYYHQPFPKSTGYEWFKAEILPLIEDSSLSIPDLLNTSVHHISEQIARQLQIHATGKSTSVLITGGGAFNSYLIELLREKLQPEIEVVVPEAELVSYKEALVFAFMGLLKMLGEINVLASVTGASKDSCSGIILEP